MTTDELILTIVFQANQLRLMVESLQKLQRRIAELEKAQPPPDVVGGHVDSYPLEDAGG